MARNITCPSRNFRNRSIGQSAAWTAIVPIKPPHKRKTRLTTIEPKNRERLTEELLDHVLRTLRAHPAIGSIEILSASRRDGYGWIPDREQGLNRELEAARASIASPVLIMHADLPLVDTEDLTVLLRSAETYGMAFAPDRHGEGTNALALLETTSFAFCFGPDSRRLHSEQAISRDATVMRSGLALDLDTPDDLTLVNALLRSRGLATYG